MYRHNALKKWLFGHFLLLLAMAAFALYGVVTLYWLPTMPYHCFMHDVMHLYCPLCGGTRAFMAVFRFDPLTVVIYNPAVLLATLVFACFDIRALVIALRGTNKALFPRFLLPLAIAWFIGYTVLRNSLLFFGVDPIGDLLPYLGGHLSGAEPILAVLALSFFGVALTLACLTRRAFWWWVLSAVGMILFFCVWYHVLWLAALVPIFGAVAAFYMHKRSHSA